jgi:YfiR/HmsC-like
MASIAAVVAVSLTLVRIVNADLVPVPLDRQAELLARVAAYDRNMGARAGDRVRVLIVSNGNDAESVGLARRMEAALGSLSEIAGLEHEERVVSFTSAADLAAQCRSQHVTILYLGSGLGDKVPAIRGALDGVDVLSVAAVPEYVEAGIVLGFDILSGKPKLLVHLTQARRQHVELRADLLKLARVYE